MTAFRPIHSHPRFCIQSYDRGDTFAVYSECVPDGWEEVSGGFSCEFNSLFCEYMGHASDDIASALPSASRRAFVESARNWAPPGARGTADPDPYGEYVAVYLREQEFWCSWIGDMCFIKSPGPDVGALCNRPHSFEMAGRGGDPFRPVTNCLRLSHSFDTGVPDVIGPFLRCVSSFIVLGSTRGAPKLAETLAGHKVTAPEPGGVRSCIATGGVEASLYDDGRAGVIAVLRSVSQRAALLKYLFRLCVRG